MRLARKFFRDSAKLFDSADEDPSILKLNFDDSLDIPILSQNLHRVIQCLIDMTYQRFLYNICRPWLTSHEASEHIWTPNDTSHRLSPKGQDPSYPISRKAKIRSCISTEASLTLGGTRCVATGALTVSAQRTPSGVGERLLVHGEPPMKERTTYSSITMALRRRAEPAVSTQLAPLWCGKTSATGYISLVMARAIYV